MFERFTGKSIKAMHLGLLCLICFLFSSCAVQPDFIDGSLPASEVFSHVDLAEHANNDFERERQLDAVLATGNESIVNLSQADRIQIENSIQLLGSIEKDKSGSVTDRAPNMNEIVSSILFFGHAPKYGADYHALNYAERLYRKIIAIEMQAGGVPAKWWFTDLAECLRKAGDTVGAQKAMHSYHEALEFAENSKHNWRVRVTALMDDARLFESEGKLAEAEQKLKLAASTCESNEDLSATRLEKVRQHNVQAQKESGYAGDLCTCVCLRSLADFYKRTGRPGEMAVRHRLQELHKQIGLS